MKTLRAGNRTVLNQQCAEGNTTIEEKTAGPTPTTGSVWQLPYYVLLYGLPQPKYFFCKDSEALRGHKIFSLNRLKKLSTAKIHFGWEFFASIFFTSCVGRKSNTLTRTGKQTKKNKFEGTSPPKRRGFIYDFLLFLISMTFSSSLRFLFRS